MKGFDLTRMFALMMLKQLERKEGIMHGHRQQSARNFIQRSGRGERQEQLDKVMISNMLGNGVTFGAQIIRVTGDAFVSMPDNRLIATMRAGTIGMWKRKQSR